MTKCKASYSWHQDHLTVIDIIHWVLQSSNTSCCNSELTSHLFFYNIITPSSPKSLRLQTANFLWLLSTGPFFLMLHEAAVASSQANRSSIRSHSHHPLCLGGVAIWLCPVPWSLPMITDYSSPEEVHIIAWPYIWVWKSSLFMGPDRLQLYACEPGGFSRAAPLLAVLIDLYWMHCRRTIVLRSSSELFLCVSWDLLTSVELKNIAGCWKKMAHYDVITKEFY